MLSDADRSKLLLLPEASIIMDPNSGVVVEEPTNAKAAGDVQPSAVVAAAAGCQAKDRYIVYKSLTRSKTVDYHFTVNWCYNSSQAITSNTRGHYIVAYTPGMYDRGFTNNNFAYTRANKYSAQVDLQSEVEQCILKYGCRFSAHPRSRWGIYGNGDYTYTGYQ